MDLRVERRTLALGTPLRTAYGTVREREQFIVCLTGADGVCGYGEASPLEPYDGVGAERVATALERFRMALADAAEDRPTAHALDVCRAADELPQALSAVDIALWDRAGRRAGKPVATLLSDSPAAAVQVNAIVHASDRAGAAEEAAGAVAQGFGCLKLKVGIGDDGGRVSAVRAAVGPEPALRLDANGAWDVEQAVRAIDALEAAGLELVEEPSHGLAAVRAVRERVAVRVAIDETAAEPGALGAGVADAVCLKVARCGGISGLLAAASLVRASGAEVYLASSLDGPLGIAAALHAAAALASRGPLPPCGLATLGLLGAVPESLTPRDGEIAVPQGPGLGVEVD